MKGKYKCKYCEGYFTDKIPVRRMHLAQHITEKLAKIKEITDELEKVYRWKF